jgi:hypothetical protein
VRSQLELADIFIKFGSELGNQLPESHKVINAIKSCRTAKLGGHKLKCGNCHHEKNAYNSCRNRHCPKCQFLKKVKWVEKRKEDLLPCQYFHVVFTVPSELRALFKQNKVQCFNLLFKASSETLKEVAKNEKNLGADIGFTGILHSWGQNLIFHPHVHFVVPGGGLNKKKNKWIHCPKDYFLPVKVLSQVFRAKMLKDLRKMFDKRELNFTYNIDYLADHKSFFELLISLSQVDWLTYSKKTFAGPEQVINYLGHYTHRIAISNYRLVKVEDGKIFFKVRDKENPGKSKEMSLSAKEFMRRFLDHILPKGYMRIRHFGILGNRYRREKIALIRALEKIVERYESLEEETWQELLKRTTGVEINKCSKCSDGEYEVCYPSGARENSS